MTKAFGDTNKIRCRTAWQSRYFMVAVAIGLRSPVHATTNAENTRAHAPMPHLNLAAGDAANMVKVHFTRLDDYLEGKPDNASRLTAMKAEAQQCMRRHEQSGKPANAPAAWPDFLLSGRTDRYATANRSIAYQFGLSYGLNPIDCSLLEVASAKAMISSNAGVCKVDLLKKTATGNCDAKAHANAPQPLRAPASNLMDVENSQRRAPNNPALAALAEIMRQHPPGGTGERKIILGLVCDIWQNPLDMGGTVCLSSGGTFIAFDTNGGTNQSNMPLEMTSAAGINGHAVEAKLDTMVNSAIFVPYLAPGFTVTTTSPRK